jgi:type III pantothenate kinase
MNLLVDLGNSRLKWAWQAPGGLDVQTRALRGRGAQELYAEAWPGGDAPARVLAACVTGETWQSALAAFARRRWRVEVEFARAQPEQLGVKNGYRDPQSLGADRWVALIAARALSAGNVCVVDCGTAVTLDALAADGRHLGGAIFPGLSLLRESLARGTAAIGDRAGEAGGVLAQATADAVAAGTLHGLAGAIARIVAGQETLAGPLSLILTGGDAGALQPLLRREARLVPDLVLQGLARIAGGTA